MKITILISIIIVQSFVSTDDNKPVVRSLCSNPWITAADRLPNNTIRVYRDDYYWELTGLPGRSGQSKGPYKVWYQYMTPIEKGSSVQTVLSGKTEGLTYKLRGNRYWVYDSSNGQLKQGGKAGYKSNALPSSGCKAVLNDGGMAGKGSALMICFDGSKVRYYKTNEREFRSYGRIADNGAYGEKFPSDISAAFAYPADDKANAKFNVYLFSKKKYCFRPYIGEDGCKEWRDSRELFGCKGNQMILNSK